MEAEDIIRQKEWQQLNAEEKVLLESLAASEQEFNLLKKLLLVASEEVADTPGLDPAIQSRLQNSLRKKPAIFFFRKWHYAAAIILLLAVCTWLFVQKNSKEPEIVKTQPQDIKNKHTGQPIGFDTLAPVITSAPPMEIEPTEVITKEKPVQLKNDTSVTNRNIDNTSPNYVSMNTTISENRALLAFVTEVYE